MSRVFVAKIRGEAFLGDNVTQGVDMAFNPFDVFRRNQRILFAGLTIVIMFMFVLSFGQGDFFSLIPRWLSARARTGEVLAVVDGSRIYQSELRELDTNRLLANEYMGRAAEVCAANAQKSLFAGLEKVSAVNKPIIEAGLRNLQVGFMPNANQAFQFYQQYGFGAPPSEGEMIAEREMTLGRTIQELRTIERAPNPAEADQTAARNLLQVIDLQQRMSAGRGKNPVYFFNAPNGSTKDRMDFLLWLKKADQLGIHYTDADVIEMTNNEFYRKLTNEDLAGIEGSLRGKQDFTPARLRASIGDEFRVRAAQAAVLGNEFLIPDGRSFDSPTQFFEFYKKQIAPATFTLVPFPAENYLDQVTGTPEETTRRELFQSGRNEDPNPGLPRFGLREPRKLKLEYVELTGDEPYFLAAATESIKLAEFFAPTQICFATPLGGQANFNLLAALAVTGKSNLLTDGLYKKYADDHRRKLGESWFSMFPSSAQPDTNLVQPQVPVALLTALHGSGNPFTALGAYAGALALADRKSRLDTLPGTFLPPLLPGLGQLAVGLSSVVPTVAAIQPLPPKAVQALLVEQLRKSQTQAVAGADAKKFSEELTKLNAPADSAEAKAKIAEFVKTRGLKLGASKDFRDMFNIWYDEGLKALREKADTPNPFNPVKITPLMFGQKFFFDVDPATRRAGPSVGFYKPQPIAQGGMPTMLYWRTAEIAAEALRDPNSPDARAKTEAAWKRKQARDLAKKAAEDFAEKCKTLGATKAEIDPKLNQMTTDLATRFADPAAKDRIKSFTIEDVAPIVASVAPGFNPKRQIGSFVLKTRDELQYPTAAMARAMVDAKDNPLGSAIVLTDNPTDTHYVAVVTNRREPTVDEFRFQLYGAASVQSEYRPLLSRMHQIELRKASYDRAVGLLKAEFGYDKESATVTKVGDSDE